MKLSSPRARLGRLQRWVHSHGGVSLQDDLQAFRVGQVLARQQQLSGPTTVEEAEFQVYSQAGEDGVINWLTHRRVRPRTFVEIGVGSYQEANTRFLLMNHHWRGVVIDATAAHIDFIRSSGLAWRFDLEPLCKHMTAENAVRTVEEATWFGQIGLLSLDIDGIDYWVLAELVTMQPAVIVCEYNAILGSVYAVSVPYRPDFERFKAHHSGLYFGASLRAFTSLLEPRGYRLVGCSSNGVNAYFVHESAVDDPPPRLSVEEAFRPSHVRQGRDASGEMTYQRAEVEIHALPPLPLVDVTTMEPVTLSDLRS